MPRPDDALRGIALAVGSTVLFATADAITKLLTAHLPVVEISWIRYVIFVAMAVWLGARARPRFSWPRSPALQITRGLCMIGSTLLFVSALNCLPLAEAATIGFVSPMFTTLLSVPLLGESVGIRRWAAVFVGFAGVLVVMHPGMAGFQWATLLPAASSLCWALALIITRRMGDTERASTTLLWTACVGAAVLSVVLPFDVIVPTADQLALAVLLGLLATIGQGLVLLAYRRVAASVLAPFTYTQLVWAGISGWLVFGNVPDRWTLLGAAIIAASGLYTAHREQVRARGGTKG